MFIYPRHSSPSRATEAPSPAKRPPSETEVIWALVDAAAGCVPAADRGTLFADVAAGDYLAAAERLLRASLAAQRPVPAAVTTALDSWLDRYAGTSEQPVIRGLLYDCRRGATSPRTR